MVYVFIYLLIYFFHLCLVIYGVIGNKYDAIMNGFGGWFTHNVFVPVIMWFSRPEFAGIKLIKIPL